MGPGRVVLAFESPFLAAQATETAAKELLRSALTAHFGRPTEATFETATPREGAPLTVAQVDSAERKARLEAARRAVSQHPLVTAAIELLGADLQAVRLPPDAGESEPQALSR
jgi:DNA polymerase-3 subunit gamma/tau